MDQLPDPTVDLDWAGFAGPIHERFRASAEATPEAICIIETKTSTTPERRFTYRQIYEASNVLAHHLHAAGVSNGDVVMIWAHRSVDLVVCIMGTLVCLFPSSHDCGTYANNHFKASGATMTVLDPAYPPARQQVSHRQPPPPPQKKYQDWLEILPRLSLRMR